MTSAIAAMVGVLIDLGAVEPATVRPSRNTVTRLLPSTISSISEVIINTDIPSSASDSIR